MRTLILTLTIVACAAAFSPVIAHLWFDPFATLTGHWNPRLAALDFNVFYAAGHQVADGHAHAIYTPSALAPLEHAHGIAMVGTNETLPYLNPPFFALLVAPLTALSFARAYQLWTAVSAIMLIFTVLMTWDATRSLPRAWRIALIIAMVTMLPVAFTLQLGQFSLALTASWMLAYKLFLSGHDERAGLALTPLLIKPEMLLPIAAILIWRRRVRAFKTLLPAGMIIAALSFALVGPYEAFHYPIYLYSNASHHLSGTDTRIMFGWNGVLDGLSAGHPGLETLISLPLIAATLCAATTCWRQPLRGQPNDLAAPWLITTMATLLIDPHLYFQDITMLAPVACVYVASIDARQRLVTSIMMGIGWCILVVGLAPNRYWGLNLFGLFLALAFGALVVHTLRRGRSPDAMAIATPNAASAWSTEGSQAA